MKTVTVRTRMKKRFLALALTAGVTGMMTGYNAYAAVQSVTANIAFDTAISLTKNDDIDFGVVVAGTADTYTIDTAGAVTAAGAGVWLGGTPTVGDITIVGSATQAVDITVGNYAANGGVTPANAQCSYDGGAEASCNMAGAAAPGAGKTLLIGVDAIVDGTQAAGATAAPTFDITVVYP